MITCIKTNLTTHFEDYLIRYINVVHKYPMSKFIKLNYSKSERKEQYKILNKELRQLKWDILNNKIEKSDTKYHEWINENRPRIIPNMIETKHVNFDVLERTQLYFQKAFYINSKIEELGYKPYQVIPLRKSVIPKHIKLNTVALADIFGDLEINDKRLYQHHKKSDLVLNAKKYGNYLWNNFLKVETKSVFKMRDHCFYREIKTDGFSCSLLFIDKRFRTKTFGQQIIQECNDVVYEKLEDLSKEQCLEILKENYKFIGNDPGSRDPLSMEDEKGNSYELSAFRRRYETYMKQYQNILYKNKEANGIFQLETAFSQLVNSRTLKEDNFKTYITEKLKFNKSVSDFYQNILYRKLSFRRFVYTKKSDALIISDIKKTFLKDDDKDKKLLIFYGDWNGCNKGVKGRIPVPTKHIKNLIFQNFQSYDTDEYLTSKVYFKTKERLENAIVKNKKGKNKKLHQVLVPKETKGRFIQRDRNSRRAILYLGKYYLEHQNRPEVYQRKEHNAD